MTARARQRWSRLLGRRELTEYPSRGTRIAYLALTVLITISLYYMAYAGSSVSTLQLADLHMSFHFAIWVVAVGNFIGAGGALVAEVSRYSTQLAPLTSIPPAVLAYADTNGPTAIEDERIIPSQMQHWYWVCFAGPIIFIFCIPLLRGRWSPRRARDDVEAHEALVRAELERLHTERPAVF